VTAIKRVVIVGASGMVGGYALRYLLENPAVGGVTSIGRRNLGVSHAKLTEILHPDFADCSPLADALTGHDAAVHCLGTYTGVVSDAELRAITVDYTIAFARVLRASSPNATFAFLSGSGADPTGRSRMPFARYKGEAENALSAAGFPRVYVFRPAYIYPVQPRREPNVSYRLLRAIYPAFRVLFPNPPAEPLLHGIRVAWIGHSTTLIQTPRLNIITDPILFDSIGPRVFSINTVTNPGLLLESLPSIDIVLISHNHYDHLDLPSLHALVDRQRSAPPSILVGRFGALRETTADVERQWVHVSHHCRSAYGNQ
jgi:hypothetical protein